LSASARSAFAFSGPKREWKTTNMPDPQSHPKRTS
jgi:hypothetical protein